MQSRNDGDSNCFPSDEDSQSSDISGPAKSASRYGGCSWFTLPFWVCLVLNFPGALLGSVGTSGYVSLLPGAGDRQLWVLVTLPGTLG